MSKNTNLFQDAWAGWSNLVRELTGYGSKKRDLKPDTKPRNMVPLKRNIQNLRRPLPKAPNRTKVEIKQEKAKLKREPIESVPEMQVDPPKPFLIDEKHLETPQERNIRI